MVKRIVVVMALSLAAQVGYASKGSLDICTAVSEVAKEAQIIRQTGIPLRDAIEIVGDKDIVIHAYLFPEGRTIEEKGRIVENFSQWVFNICMKTLGE